MGRDILIVADFRPGGGGGERIVAPWIAVLPEPVDLFCAMPIVDLNAEANAALAGAGKEGSGAALALYLGDPFLRPRDQARALRAAGISAIANMPPVDFVDGEAGRAFEAAGIGHSREAQMMAAFAAEGVRLLAFACTVRQAKALAAAGAGTIAIHPGPPLADWRERAVAARAAARRLSQLRDAAPGAELLLYRPESFGAELDAAAALADGTVRMAARAGSG